MIPYAPRERFTQPNRLSDLILRSGDAQADAHLRSGQIWGNTIGKLGNIASGYVEDRAAQKQEQAQAAELSRRDQAALAVMSNPDADPLEFVRIYGPREGIKVAQGFEAFKKIGAGHSQSPEDLFKLYGGLNAVGEKVRAAAYPTIVANVSKAIPALAGALPQEYSAEGWKEIGSLLGGMNPAKPGEGFTLGQGQVRFGPDGKQIAAGPVGVPEPPKPGSFEAFVVGKFGNQPTPDQQIAARKEWELANDRPVDPVARELGLIRVNEAREKAKAAQDAEKAFSAVPAERRAAIDRVTNSMPDKRAKSWKATLADAATSGNEDEFKSQIKQAAIESEPVEIRKQVTGRDEMVGLLTEAKTILRDMKARGVPTNFFTGSAEDILRKVGTTSNPEYVALGNRLAETLINYRRAATGAAFSDKESVAYEKMFPNYRNTLPVNEALIDGLIGAASTNSRTYWSRKVGEKNADWIVGVQKPMAQTPSDAPVKPQSKGRLVQVNGIWKRVP